MNQIVAIFKTFAPRVIAIGVTGAAGWLYAHTKGAVVVDVDQAAKMITGALLTYAGTHRAVSAVFNPGDAASARLADAEHQAVSLNTNVRVAPKSK